MPAGVVLMAALSGVLAGCRLVQFDLRTPTRLPETIVTGGRGREIALVSPFIDMRHDREHCGRTQTLVGIDDLRCADPPREWLPHLLATELSRAGFLVVSPSRASADAVRLEGTLLTLSAAPDGSQPFADSAQVVMEVRLRVTSASGLEAERDFHAAGSSSTVFGGEETVFQVAHERAAGAVLTEMSAAIVELLDRYPGLGRPGASAMRGRGSVP